MFSWNLLQEQPVKISYAPQCNQHKWIRLRIFGWHPDKCRNNYVTVKTKTLTLHICAVGRISNCKDAGK